MINRRLLRNLSLAVAAFAAGAIVSCAAGRRPLGFVETDPVYIPSKFATLASLDAEEFGPALRSLRRDDHIAMFFEADETRDTTVEFFTKLTGSEPVAKAILENAERHQVPRALAFAVAYIESNFKVTAVGHNADSIDRGLFQLNNRSFPKLALQDFFNIEKNAYHGLAHLAYCLDVGGNEVAALAIYNAGHTRVTKGGTPRRTLNYINAVMNFKLNLEALFEAQVVAKGYNQKTARLLLARAEGGPTGN